MTSHFTEQIKSFGIVRENKTITIPFVANIDIPEVVDIVIPCGCNKGTKYDAGTRTLNVIYKSGYIPNHLDTRQSVNKQIIVVYKDNTQEILVVTGVKIK